MAYILRDGKVYEQTISEYEVDIKSEEQKLQAFKDAILVDAREEKERQDAFIEIDKVALDKDLKDRMKSQLTYSGSGITQKMVDEQQLKLDAIYKVKK